MIHIRDLSDNAIFDTEGLCRLLDIHEKTVLRCVADQSLRGGKRLGKWWFSGKDVKEWLLSDSSVTSNPKRRHAESRTAHQ